MFFLYFVEVGNFTVNRFGQNAMITVFDIWLVESGYWSFIYAQ